MIFNFTDYRDFLKEFIRLLPKGGHGEAKRIADHLQVSSTYISHVMAGTRELNLEQAVSLCGYLGLRSHEADYFFYLVQASRAGTQPLRDFCEEKLQDIRKKSLKLVDRIEIKKTLNDQEKAVFYSSALYSAIHIFCATHKTGKTIEEIVIRFEIARTRASEIVQFLIGAGLCIDVNGHTLSSSMGTHLESGSPHLPKHHANWRLRSIQASENLSEQELMYTVNVALSKKDFTYLREEMVGFIQKFLEKVYPSPSEDIATLNLDWFWIRK